MVDWLRPVPEVAVGEAIDSALCVQLRRFHGQAYRERPTDGCRAELEALGWPRRHQYIQGPSASAPA